MIILFAESSTLILEESHASGDCVSDTGALRIYQIIAVGGGSFDGDLRIVEGQDRIDQPRVAIFLQCPQYSDSQTGELAAMTSTPLNVTPAHPAMRHHIRGTHNVDAFVATVEVLMHPNVSLDRWSLRSAANALKISQDESSSVSVAGTIHIEWIFLNASNVV